MTTAPGRSAHHREGGLGGAVVASLSPPGDGEGAGEAGRSRGRGADPRHRPRGPRAHSGRADASRANGRLARPPHPHLCRTGLAAPRHPRSAARGASLEETGTTAARTEAVSTPCGARTPPTGRMETTCSKPWSGRLTGVGSGACAALRATASHRAAVGGSSSSHANELNNSHSLALPRPPPSRLH